MSEQLEEDSAKESDSSDSKNVQNPATSKSLLQLTVALPAAIAILLVRSYQVVLSPLLGRTCRFHPSCSQYYILAVRKYGLFFGTWRGICRISRCHPWNPGGYDPP